MPSAANLGLCAVRSKTCIFVYSEVVLMRGFVFWKLDSNTFNLIYNRPSNFLYIESYAHPKSYHIRDYKK